MESDTSHDHGDKLEREFVGNCHSTSAVEKPNKAQRRETMCILSDFYSNVSFSGAGLLNERESPQFQVLPELVEKRDH